MSERGEMAERRYDAGFADVAQLVEHWLPKPGVAGSSPVVRLAFVHAIRLESRTELRGAAKLAQRPSAFPPPPLTDRRSQSPKLARSVTNFVSKPDILLMTRPYPSRVARCAVALVLAVAIGSAVVAGAPAADRADPSVFAGLGTWVDIYDSAVYAAPERAAERMAARRIETVWVETANHGAATDVVEPARLGRLVDALRARGVRTVAWYLPGHINPSLDRRRALAMLTFRTPQGGSFDAVALNIESTRLRNTSLRSQRAVSLARQLRQAAGETPIAIVPFNPRGLERRPTTWPRFPWKDLVAQADAVAPMIYTGGAYKGFDATYGYVTRALRLLRAHTGNPEVSIHVAGGVADRLGPDELAGFAAAVEDDGGTIGVSLYDWMTTPARAWPVLERVSR